MCSGFIPVEMWWCHDAWQAAAAWLVVQIYHTPVTTAMTTSRCHWDLALHHSITNTDTDRTVSPHWAESPHSPVPVRGHFTVARTLMMNPRTKTHTSRGNTTLNSRTLIPITCILFISFSSTEWCRSVCQVTMWQQMRKESCISAALRLHVVRLSVSCIC